MSIRWDGIDQIKIWADCCFLESSLPKYFLMLIPYVEHHNLAVNNSEKDRGMLVF